MNLLKDYTPFVLELISAYDNPWNLTDQLSDALNAASTALGDDYERRDGYFIHKTATVHPTAVMKDELSMRMHL